MHKKTTLDNGLRIVTASIPHVHSVSMGVIVGAGSRYEKSGQAGDSHFIEHLVFQGRETRPTSKASRRPSKALAGCSTAARTRSHHLLVQGGAIPLPALRSICSRTWWPPPDGPGGHRAASGPGDHGGDSTCAFDSPQTGSTCCSDELLWPRQPLGRDVAAPRRRWQGDPDQDTLMDLRRHATCPTMPVVAVAGEHPHGPVDRDAKGVRVLETAEAPPEWVPVTAGAGGLV